MGACRTCLIFITIQLVSFATSQETVKRVPQGFLGMRGKKYFGDESTEQFYKRKPQFFVGVKGKKSLQELLETGQEFEKKAPMGFMGMRGKKDSLYPEYEFNDYAPKRDGSLIGQIDYTSNDRNEQNAFPILNEILQHYINRFRNSSPTNMYSESLPDEGSNEIEKRAANMHQFYGVRGKKSVNIKRPYDVSFRGKFIGVRGKKDVGVKDDAPAPSEIRFLLNNPLKRKSQMGFFGMRGKKWDDAFESSQEMESPI